MFKISRMIKTVIATGLIFSAGLMIGCSGSITTHEGHKEFLNVSYDPTRELCASYNEKFREHWTKELGKGEVMLTQSHGGSGK